MNQALNAKKLFVSLMSAAVLATLLVTPFSASAAASTIGSFNTSMAGTATNVIGCKTYSGKNVIVKITAKAPAGATKLKYKTLTLWMSTNKTPSYQLGRVSTNYWALNTSASLTISVSKESKAHVDLKSATSGIQMQVLNQYRQAASSGTVINPAKLPNC